MTPSELEMGVVGNGDRINTLLEMFIELQQTVNEIALEGRRSAMTAIVNDEQTAKQLEDFRYFEESKCGQVRVSSVFGDTSNRKRIFSMKMNVKDRSEIMENDPQKVQDICHLRSSPGGQVEIKAVRMEDEYGLDRLILQRWDTRSTIPKKQAMTFVEDEISELLAFLISSFHARYADNSRPKKELETILTRACHCLEDAHGG